MGWWERAECRGVQKGEMNEGRVLGVWGCGERSHGKLVIENVEWLYRCINGFKYQRRCHKLTLGLATERLRELRRGGGGGGRGGEGWEEVVEVGYQEPPESYFGKFKRNWAMYFGFLMVGPYLS
ncbi:hypothetical protein AKJ16_DCAP15391 [Drosera capensis]